MDLLAEDQAVEQGRLLVCCSRSGGVAVRVLGESIVD